MFSSYLYINHKHTPLFLTVLVLLLFLRTSKQLYKSMNFMVKLESELTVRSIVLNCFIIITIPSFGMIYHNVRSALENQGHRGQVSIWAYCEKNDLLLFICITMISTRNRTARLICKKLQVASFNCH